MVYPIAKEQFDYEIMLPFFCDVSLPYVFSKAMSEGLWVIKNDTSLKVKIKNIIEIAIPFDDIGVGFYQKVDFLILF